MIESTNDFSCLFNHRFLIFTNRHCSSLESSNISSLTDRISKETYRNACFKITHLNFSLYCRITLQSRNSYQIHKIETQLIKFRNLRLNKNSRLSRIKSRSKIIQSHFDYILTYFSGLSILSVKACPSASKTNILS